MTSIANVKFTPALPPIIIRPHGHKKNSHVGPFGDAGSDTAAQVPVATAQNLFGSLLQSLEQVIGLQSATAAATPTTSADGSQNSTAARSGVSVRA